MNRDDEYKSMLIDTIKKLGIELSERQAEQFLLYYRFLTEKNKVMNLTAITEYSDVVLKHFADSLSIVKLCDMESVQTMIDIGTGAGFPGIPIKIVFPKIRVVLLDSLNKRIRFLEELIGLLRLDYVSAVHARAEDAAKEKAYRERFDLCVSRAVANLSSLSEYCIPFVKKGGLFVSYKSTNIDTEIQDSEHAISLLGGQIKEKKEFCLPNSDVERTLILIKKRETTPAKYPRKAGLPSKEPL